MGEEVIFHISCFTHHEKSTLKAEIKFEQNYIIIIDIESKERFEIPRIYLKKLISFPELNKTVFWFHPFFKLIISPLFECKLFPPVMGLQPEQPSIPKKTKVDYLFLHEEYKRQIEDNKAYRSSQVNSEYEVCPTLSGRWIVPSSVNDTLLTHAARFRARARLPILSYSRDNLCIIRSSQPLCGLGYKRSVQDEKLIKSFTGTDKELIIVDARSLTSALGNALTGKGGTELESFYGASRKVYLGLENIHAVRRAEYYIIANDKEGNEEPWCKLLNDLHKGVQLLYELLMEREEGICLLIHCSDGWDRTAQIVSLLQILLDSRYRTRRGLATLIEKEWLASGFQFTLRSLPSFSSPHDNIPTVIEEAGEDDCGQIWGQFLNLLYCWVIAAPDCFTFGESDLQRLWLEGCQENGVLQGDYENDLLRTQTNSARNSFWKEFAEKDGNDEDYPLMSNLFEKIKNAPLSVLYPLTLRQFKSN